MTPTTPPSPVSATATADAAGVATVTIRTQRQATWVVSQISVECVDAPGNATCTVRLNGRLVSPAIPQGDAVAGDPPVLVRPSDTLTVTWTNLAPGTVADVLYIFQELSYA